MSRSRADCWCKHPERDVLALGSRRPRTSIQGLKRRQYREPHRSKTPEAHQSSCSHKDKSRERTQPKAPARKRHLPAANRLNRHLDSRKTARNTKPPPGPPTTEPEPNPSSPSKSLNHQTTSKHTKRRKGNRELRVRQTLSGRVPRGGGGGGGPPVPVGGSPAAPARPRPPTPPHNRTSNSITRPLFPPISPVRRTPRGMRIGHRR